VAAWKTLRITKPCKVSISNRNLMIVDEDARIKLNLSDIDSIVFEGDQFTVTGKVMADLGKAGIATLFCDRYYMPVSILVPYFQSATGNRVAEAQINLPLDTRRELWKKIIESKLSLQSKTLSISRKTEASKRIELYSKSVTKGDDGNMEAAGARLYWQEMFENFKREQDSLDVRNQGLNYAYAILRSLIARNIAASGMIPSFGIWHSNSLNPFNLCDDLMEPFRPILDIALKHLIDNEFGREEYLTPEAKRRIISVFDWEYVLLGGLTSIRSASIAYVAGFKSAILRKESDKFILPDFDPEKLYECL